ncbi:MAG: quinone-dependent dihydroorotate dehydrogenase, partial [Anaerolineales bacterium]|nr:quinone-dependent dihydroorotate dehydrogenase [Anaerolineales bacterium]
PNTPGLRDLQGGDYLGHLLDTLLTESRELADQFGISKRPLFLKIAPDLTETELDEILDVVLNRGIDGLIATNTTLSREGLRHANRRESGGLSGAPLTQRSTEIIHRVHEKTNGQLPIIGVGGVRTAADVRDKLAAGASLVQLYTGLVYEGPAIAGEILRTLASST